MSKPGTRRGWTIAAACAAAAIIAVWALRRSDSRYDRALAHPTLRDLVEPYQLVFAGVFLDGGSIGIKIIDSNGRMAQFSSPPGDDRSYSRLYAGAYHWSETNAVEIPFNHDTRRMLIAILEAHPGGNLDHELALVNLKGELGLGLIAKGILRHAGILK